MDKFLKRIFTVALLGLLLTNVDGQTIIDYELVYNQTNCNYEAHIHVSGDSRFGPDLISSPIQYTVVVPESIGDAPFVATSVNPPGAIYTDANITTAPTSAPESDFHSFSYGGGAFFTTINAGDDIILFTFELPANTCGSGIRLFVNGSDPSSSDPGMGGTDHSQSFQLVGPPYPTAYELYNANLSNDAITIQDPTATPAASCDANFINLMTNGITDACASGTTMYSWTGPNSFSSSDENPVFPLDADPNLQAGIYTVTITDSNNCTVEESVSLTSSNCASITSCNADNGTIQLMIGN